MKKVKSLMLALFMIAVLTQPLVSYADSAAEPTSPTELDIQQYVSNMQPGWNLGNTFDAVGEDETAWGNPFVTQLLIEQLAEQGYKSIRIPVTFDGRMETSEDFTINADFLSRLDQAIQWSLDEGLYVMINIHHDSWIWLETGMAANHDESLARYEAIWSQLVERYKDYPLELMFESINEPRFVGTDAEKQGYLNELNSSFYQIVRSSGGLNLIRPLVLPTLDTGSEQAKLDALYNFIEPLDDPNIIATVHYYGFWPFSVNVAGFTTFNDETKQDIITTFDRVHHTFAPHNIPVIIGEYGLLGFDTDINAIQQGEKLKFFEFMIHYANEKDFTHMLWDNGQHFNRHSYQWSNQELFEMMKASWSTRSATATTDSVFLKRGEEIKDVHVPLQLNGHTFTVLKLNDEPLVAEQDYELNEHTLILKASLLKELADFKQFGTRAELSLEFNEGKDWKLFIITYKTATPKSVVGTTSEFSIPLAFNGDKLATLEANYADGSNAGPHNWTSFKEFAYTFKPNYSNNTLSLTPLFFNEINDSETVKLKLHFWSGELLEYSITKKGDKVTGTFVQGNNGGNGNGSSAGDSEGESSNESTDQETGESNNEPSDESLNIVVSYTDIAAHWGYVGIYRGTQLGIINGYQDGSFRPDQVITRAELAAIIGRTLNLSSDITGSNDHRFVDDETIPSYAKAYIAKLSELGLFKGYNDGSFRPTQKVTRAELAVIAARFLGLTGSSATNFTDDEHIPAWAKNEIALLTDLGIMSSNTQGNFYPNREATRAETVVMIVRIIDHLKAQPITE